ncbi:hypothetical protein LIER_38585 [Lithospermum erythrorhizon]|uniref:Uncharacterized protein n=1 Tax=Lithospermum erythrorhizon TaxID=34254 RepID=A0AAV3Q555_LITER
MTKPIFSERVEGDKRYLQISDDTLMTITELLVYESLLGGLVKPWPKFCRADYESGGWTDTKSFGQRDVIICYTLLQKNSSLAAEVIPSQLLRTRISSVETSWGTNLRLHGEFAYTQSYWEWAEDVLRRCRDILINADLRNAVYASLYTYDCLPDIILAFYESWSPSTNTLFTVAWESSICLWDLHKLGGLAILAQLFDDVVPSARELMDDTYETESKLPQTCTYLLHAYHLLFHRKGRHVVSIADWIQFWSKLPPRYNAPPPRKECKTRHSASTHNLT